MPINNHTLLIKYEGHIEFKAIFTSDGYFRVQVDKIGYEKMIDELWDIGYETFEKTAEEPTHDGCTRDIFNITNIQNFNKNVQDIYNFLVNEGFDCELISESQTPTLTVTGYGKDLHPDVIANTEDNILSDFTINLYKAVNIINYEPKIEKQASSFKVLVKELEINDNNLSTILNDFKNKIFHTDKYFSDEYYKKLINTFINLRYIKTIKSIKINEDDNFSFSKNDIIEFEKIKNDKISERPFSQTVTQNEMRAFDSKNLSFKYDSIHGVLHMSLDEINFNKIKRNLSRPMQLTGTYKSIKSIHIETVTILT